MFNEMDVMSVQQSETVPTKLQPNKMPTLKLTSCFEEW